jgi:subtilisin family serine protease
MKRDDIKPDVGRFVPAGGLPQPEHQSPAVVQVQLKSEPAGELFDGTSSVGFASPAGIGLSGLHRVVTSHGMIKAEHSFRTPQVPANAFLAAPSGVGSPPKRRFVDLHFPASADLEKIVAELRDLPEVERAVAMPKAIPPNSFPTDPLVGNSDQLTVDPITGLESEWYIFRCKADRAWSSSSGRNVIIADIDFGFLVTHQDLAPNLDLSHAHNAVDGSTNVSAGGNTDHGTGVLGLAGAARNAEGMVGFAYDATLWPIQANAGSGPELPGDAFANAIDFVARSDSGGKRVIINLEVQTGKFGNYEMVPAVNSAIRDAIAKGIVVCVAAGNGDRDAGIGDDGTPIPPTGSILVGATAFDPSANRRAWFSNWGPRVVVGAPGDSDHDLTCSISANDAYRNGFGGTSGATPKISGAVALMLEANPSLTHEQVRQILMATGTPIPADDGKAIGVFLNASAAVASAAASKSLGGSIPA